MVNFEARDIHVDVFKDGKQVYVAPTVQESAEYFKEGKELIWSEYKRLLNPEFYPVDLSTKCWKNRNNIMKKFKVVRKNQKLLKILLKNME